MKHNHYVLHIVLALACVLLIGRPQRLWSAVIPLFGQESLKRLDEFSSPANGPADSRERLAMLENAAFESNGAVNVSGVIKSGENLDLVLRGAGISAGRSLAFGKRLKKVFDPRRSRPGDKYSIWIADGQISHFSYRRSPVERYEVYWNGSDWEPERIEVPMTRTRDEVAGTLRGSLWESFQRSGADPDLIMSFIDLFSWDVDFTHESQNGDEFRVVYEKLYADGEFLGNGKILAASYRDRDETHRAIYFNSGETKGYFEDSGKSVRKSFLRAPLQFSRISSRFSYRRRHPITKKVKPHLGVDYAAPIGTPVWSVANGTVMFAGRKGQNGNMISIRHAMGYETYYLHLSRYAKGVRRGASVGQGQVIGYVGSTGMSTGPHLDYRVKKSGRWVNPIREKYKPGPPVPEGQMEEFTQWALNWTGQLDRLELGTRVAESIL